MEKFLYILATSVAAAFIYIYLIHIAPAVQATTTYSVIIVALILSTLILAGLTIIEKYGYPSMATVKVIAQWLLILALLWTTWLITASIFGIF